MQHYNYIFLLLNIGGGRDKIYFLSIAQTAPSKCLLLSLAKNQGKKLLSTFLYYGEMHDLHN